MQKVNEHKVFQSTEVLGIFVRNHGKCSQHSTGVEDTQLLVWCTTAISTHLWPDLNWIQFCARLQKNLLIRCTSPIHLPWKLLHSGTGVQECFLDSQYLVSSLILLMHLQSTLLEKQSLCLDFASPTQDTESSVSFMSPFFCFKPWVA